MRRTWRITVKHVLFATAVFAERRPLAPYGVSKLFAYWTIVNYREAGSLIARKTQRMEDAERIVAPILDDVAKDYAGRLTAHLPMATRVLMMKADGSVLVVVEVPLLASTATTIERLPLVTFHASRASTSPRHRISSHRSSIPNASSRSCTRPRSSSCSRRPRRPTRRSPPTGPACPSGRPAGSRRRAGGRGGCTPA